MDVTGSLGTAWQRTSQQLFKPFRAGTWISFGVIFFLQMLAEGGSGGSFRKPNFGGSSGPGGTAPPLDLHRMLDEARTWMADNATLVVVLSIVAVITLVALTLVTLWLGTRGQMMSIRAVATGRPAIGEHWRETRKPAWSLFKFSLALSGISLLLWGPLLGFALYRVVDLVDAGVTDADALALGLLPFLVVGALFVILLGVVRALLRNFVAPFMLQFDLPCMAAWRRFLDAVRGHWGSVLLFFVIRAGLGLGAGLVAVVLTFCTCCLGAFPVIQQTLLAPYYVLERAYGLYAIASLGPEYQMMQPLQESGPPPGPGGYYPPPGAPYPPPPPPAGTWGASG